MWKNLLEGTEAAIAAALEHTAFPQPEEDEGETNRNQLENDSSKMTSSETTKKKDDSDEKNLLDAKEINSNNSSILSNGDKKEKKKSAWYEENEDDEQPSVDNWFMPVPSIDLGGLPSIFTSVGTSSNANNESNEEQTKNVANMSQGELFETIHYGWDNLQKAAQVQLSEARKFLQESVDTVVNGDVFNPTYTPRDLSLPYDTEALYDAKFFYVTDRIISISHLNVINKKSKISNQRKLSAVAHLLQKRHSSHFMIWDLSEMNFIESIFEDQVISTNFPGLPCPPLGLLIRLILSIDHWLKSSPNNVAVFHCLTGEGRTATLLACFLSWTGEAGLNTPSLALDYIAQCKNMSPLNLTIPSQRRYTSYFEKMLEGARPRVASIWLKRVIISEAPKFGVPPKTMKKSDDNNTNDLSSEATKGTQTLALGCAPYIEIYKGDSLIFSTPAVTTNEHNSSNTLNKEDTPYFLNSSGSVSFHIDLDLQGDILFRFYHIDSTEAEESKESKKVTAAMFRAMFNTGFVEISKVLRFTKSQLDGIETNDEKISEDFYVDLVFESNLNDMDKSDEPSTAMNNHSKKSDLAIIPSKYDSILFKHSNFWESITNRRKKMLTIATNDSEENMDKSKETKVLSGPVIGNLRSFESNNKNEKTDSNNKDIMLESMMTSLDMKETHESELMGKQNDVMSSKEEKRRLKNRRIALLDILSTSDDEDMISLKKSKSNDEEEEQIVFDNDDAVHELLSSLDEQKESLAESVPSDAFLEEENKLKDLDDLENFLQQM